MVRFARNAGGSSRYAAGNARIAAWALVIGQAAGVASAQTPPPAKTDGEIKTPYLDNYTPSEEVKRRALGPLRIIKQTAEQKKPAAPAPSPAPAPAPVHTPAPPPTVFRPKVEDAPAKVEKKAPAVAETPAPAPVAAAAPAPAPVPVAPPPAPVQAARIVNTELIPLVQDPPVLSRNLMREIPAGGGLVKVAFDVKTDGSTGDIQVVSSSNRRLNSAATDAVAKWRFKPIDESVRVDIELRFLPPE